MLSVRFIVWTIIYCLNWKDSKQSFKWKYQAEGRYLDSWGDSWDEFEHIMLSCLSKRNSEHEPQTEPETEPEEEPVEEDPEELQEHGWWLSLVYKIYS